MNLHIESLLPDLAKAFEADYSQQFRSLPFSIVFEHGKKYIRIIGVDSGQRSCRGFICAVDTAKFKAGDLLKCASWNAPATNFARGSIFDIPKAVADGHIRWTGIAWHLINDDIE